MKIKVAICIIVFYHICNNFIFSQKITDSLVYEVGNQIISHYQIKDLYRNGSSTSLSACDGSIILPTDSTNYMFKTKFCTNEILKKLYLINASDFTSQLSHNKSFKWNKNKIHPDVKLRRRNLLHIFRIPRFKVPLVHDERNFLSVPVFDKKLEFAFVYYSTSSGPESEFSGIEVFYFDGKIWIPIGVYNQIIS